MERIAGRKIPSSKPYQDIIPHRKCPNEREVRHGDDASSIGNITPDLQLRICPARRTLVQCAGVKGLHILEILLKSVISHTAQDEVDDGKGEDRE